MMKIPRWEICRSWRWKHSFRWLDRWGWRGILYYQMDLCGFFFVPRWFDSWWSEVFQLVRTLGAMVVNCGVTNRIVNGQRWPKLLKRGVLIPVVCPWYILSWFRDGFIVVGWSFSSVFFFLLFLDSFSFLTSFARIRSWAFSFLSCTFSCRFSRRACFLAWYSYSSASSSEFG